MKRKGSKCSRCRYGRAVDLGDGGEMLTGCVYILKTGQRRGCAPGDKCDKFKPRGRREFTEGWFEGK